MKKLLFIIPLLFFASCYKNNKIIDKAHKTFYVNGISAIEGKDKIISSLKGMGFEMDGDTIADVDLSVFGKEHTQYAVFKAKSITPSQFSALSYGLFDDLPALYYRGETPITEDSCRIFLSWYLTGEVEKYSIMFGDYNVMPDENVVVVNKRLAEQFPHSKIGNKDSGYRVYYDDNGVELYFTDLYFLDICKKEQEE